MGESVAEDISARQFAFVERSLRHGRLLTPSLQRTSIHSEDAAFFTQSNKVGAIHGFIF
jgi:hypothetical protein